jgi:hypothetical protein
MKDHLISGDFCEMVGNQEKAFQRMENGENKISERI